MKSFAEYYQSEWHALRKLGGEFAKQHPRLAPFLANDSADPQVQQIQASLAFLSARLQQKSDAAMPELAHQIVQTVAPDYLRVQPAMSIMKYRLKPSAPANPFLLRAGSTFEVEDSSGSSGWQTCADVSFYPFQVVNTNCNLKGRNASVKITCRSVNGLPVSIEHLTRLRFYIEGDVADAYSWHGAFTRGRRRVTLKVDDKVWATTARIDASGLSRLQSPSKVGWPPNLLRLFFSVPYCFLFVDILDLNTACHSSIEVTEFSIMIEVEGEDLPSNPVELSLYCVPIVNIEPLPIRPFALTDQKDHYPLLPDGEQAKTKGCWCVTEVSGWKQGEKSSIAYQNFCSVGGVSDRVYQIRQYMPPLGKGWQTQIHFSGKALGEREIISVEALGFDVNVSRRLSRGQIMDVQPSFEGRSNAPISMPVYPPCGQEAVWGLVNHVSMSLRQLDSAEAFRSWLSVFYWPHVEDHASYQHFEQVRDAVMHVVCDKHKILHEGNVLYGSKTTIQLQARAFMNRGEVNVFGHILNLIFQDAAPVNSFHCVELVLVEHNETLTWPSLQLFFQ